MSTRRQALKHLAAAGAAVLSVPALAQGGRRVVLGQSAALTGPAAQLGLQITAAHACSSSA